VQPEAILKLAPTPIISVNIDRSAQGIPSVCLDEAAIAQVALQHLLDTGLRQLTTFRFDNSPFAIARERAFVEGARAAGAQVSPGWGSGGAGLGPNVEVPSEIFDWLLRLPKPCGIFTCTDIWGRAVARYVRAAGLSVPEQIALVGADNDVLECELISPPLSSVIIPWQELGRNAAHLVQLALAGKMLERKALDGKARDGHASENGASESTAPEYTALEGTAQAVTARANDALVTQPLDDRVLEGKPLDAQRLISTPLTVMTRRSSDVFAVSDPLVAQAVRWIRANAERRITVTMVANAVSGGRKRLERRFRVALDRTVHDEIRRAHVDVAKGLLAVTNTSLVDVARQSGFTNAALLSVAFHREVGMPPGLYRRRMQQEVGRPVDE
jgi:LacI family transcriptional regulator